MKSEHRHDLQTNELGKFAEKAAIYIDRHGNRLMIGICVAALALSGGIFWWRTESGNKLAAWSDLSTAISTGKPELLHDVWSDHPGTLPAMWAKVHEGETLLGRGVEAIFRNVETGSEDLKKSRAAFQMVIDERKAPPDVRERALIGLGRALESMSDGSEDEAIKAYETLVKEFPKSRFKADAEARIEILKSGRGQEFYAWFAKYPRPKFAEKLPRDLTGDDLDEDSMSNLQDILDSTKKSATKKKPAPDDEESLKLPDEKDSDEKKTAESSDADGGKKPAEPKSKSGAEPKPEPPSEPETKPE
jgi:hypothetical protein